MKRHKYIPRALVVHYSEGRPGDPARRTSTIILCDKHRPAFYSFHPEACGYGEWKPVEECDHCKREAK